MDFKKLVKFDIKKFSSYKSARSLCVKGNIWLNANESPISYEFSTVNKHLNRYPDSQSKDILYKYSKYSNIDYNNILISRGIDESIELLIKTFCNPFVDKIIYFYPTYDMYKITAEIFGVESIKIFLKNDSLKKYEKIKNNINYIKLIYICRPNNPTGCLMSKKELINILEITFGKALVIVDEAYIEFCILESVVPLIKKYSNLVVLRTLSKAFGLAGIRCGFTLANSEIIKILNKVISPYPIPSITYEIANFALNKSFLNFMEKTVLKLNKNKNWLLKELKKISYVKKIFKSFANYILVEFYDSSFIFKNMNKKGIILRDQSYKKGLKNCIRISVGNKIECKKLIYELKKKIL